MDNIKLALKKILDVLGLQYTRVRYNRNIRYVNENNHFVRKFKDAHGREMTFYISAMVNSLPFPCGGVWTIFKDDDTATFELFTKIMKQFDLSYEDDTCDKIRNIKNPFFGCKTPEEVLVTCDLAGMS